MDSLSLFVLKITLDESENPNEIIIYLSLYLCLRSLATPYVKNGQDSVDIQYRKKQFIEPAALID